MRLTFLALIIACTHLACITHPADPPLQVGLASTDITPPIGYRLAGYYYERLATAVHDPLFAKAIVFKQGETRFALVICDLCHTSPAVVAQARTLASEKTGIPADQIAVCATHTHTGPDYFGPLADHLHELAIAAHNGEDPARPIDYPALLAEKIAQCIIDADRAAAPAQLSVGHATQENLAFNRRYVMKDGTVAWNPGKKNPNIDHPAGPIDPQIDILRIDHRSATTPAAILTRFPLHPDTVGGA
jgi:neutral ceramidase